MDLSVEIDAPMDFSEEKPKPFAPLMKKKMSDLEEAEVVKEALPSPMQMIQQHVTAERIETVQEVSATALIKEVVYTIHHMKKNGILDMHWELELPHLKNIDIHIRHYDTAPDRFYVEIGATAEAQEMLQRSLPMLEARLASELVKMECHFKPVVISPRKSRENRKKIVQSPNVVYSAN